MRDEPQGFCVSGFGNISRVRVFLNSLSESGVNDYRHHDQSRWTEGGGGGRIAGLAFFMGWLED